MSNINFSRFPVAERKKMGDRWLEENQANTGLCQCGCGEKIRIRRIHHYNGIPRYIQGHHIKGNKNSTSTRLKKSEAQRGKKNNNWKGGIPSISKRIRISTQYKNWRSQVFIRDNFVCQKCFIKSPGYLEAHHKKPFHRLIQEIKRYLPLFNLYDGAMLYSPLWNINNGITLCQNCHNKKPKGRPRKAQKEMGIS